MSKRKHESGDDEGTDEVNVAAIATAAAASLDASESAKRPRLLEPTTLDDTTGSFSAAAAAAFPSSTPFVSLGAFSADGAPSPAKLARARLPDPTSMPAAFGCASPDTRPVPPAVVLPLSALPNEKKSRKVKVLSYYVELSDLEWRIVDTPHYAAKRKVSGGNTRGGTLASRSFPPFTPTVSLRARKVIREKEEQANCRSARVAQQLTARGCDAFTIIR
jgi:hypothetical protein